MKTARPFADLVRHRLLALIERAGTNPTALAVDHGRARSHWTRKLLRPHGTERALQVEDVDEILQALGLDSAALLEPVLLPGDRELLAWVRRRTEDDEVHALLSEATATFTDVEARLARLTPEGLLFALRHPEVGDVLDLALPDPQSSWVVLNPATLAPQEAA